MNIIKLSRTDLSEMIKHAVHSLLNESVREEMGSIVSDKEDVIGDIVEYVENEWENIKANNLKPASTESYTLNVDGGKENTVKSYVILVPDELVEKLGVAEKFELNIGIQDYTVDEDLVKYFGHSERAAGGTSYAGQKYDEFNRSKMITKNGRVDITVPAINGELQTMSLYSTLYHELNHNMSQTQARIKKVPTVSYDEADHLNLIQLSKRRDKSPHFMVQNELHPDEFGGFLQALRFGKYVEELKDANFILYALWERTERNARAEQVYGDLFAMKTTRESFRKDYKETELYFQLNQFKELLETIKKVPVNTEFWDYIAEVINMKPKGLNAKNVDRARNQFQQEVKDRFISRTEELIEILYRKGMKVAELYLQRHEPKPELSKLERYKQEHNTK